MTRDRWADLVSGAVLALMFTALVVGIIVNLAIGIDCWCLDKEGWPR